MFESLAHLQSACKNTLQITDEKIRVLNLPFLQQQLINQLVYTAQFSSDKQSRHQSRWIIKKTAQSLGIFSASIRNIYRAIGNKECVQTFTVPAMNIRTLTYDIAQVIFRLVKEKNVGPFIFEISRGEMDYTDQRPESYLCAILGAAVQQGYTGPVFIQGDHFQFSEKIYKQNPGEEQKRLQSLIDESIAAAFYNIDIDASTLVDLSKENLDQQQKENYKNTALLTTYIRQHQPRDVDISVGGEIGHIGDRNSTVGDFEAFMEGFLKQINCKMPGISKISVQTGTSHGGIPLPDGSMKKVTLDFTVLKTIGEKARKKYRMGGAVQHGASTLPNEMFHLFPENNTLEIHLATGFQNIVYDNIPYAMKQTIYAWLDQHQQNEKDQSWTHEQFLYKTRKRALGPFKQALWEMRSEEKQTIVTAVEKELDFLFEKLKIANTRNVIDTYLT